ncbi:Ig-like domain-containing protein [Flavobacterium sp. KACC 22763]|uniref:Ig-like domain-containing protein n=1 Tax=Flavobacterium sp. KACC 22763 TaxID=3025668 RepID=UPI002365B902|nr:gliding motility-associated C-terminal domain-containing protein [Flavobacterium sp. KACC 22763]WDF66145.1 gliding motility-associated C-terminal domain-containing protein [Flavobacterium sp. KACC 22763]
MKNTVKILLVFITVFLVTSVSAQTNYSFSIADILSSMPNGKRMPDGTIVKAQLITTGSATHSTGAAGSGTAGPDIGGIFTGITLPAYVGDKTPTNFTKIQMANTQNADNGVGNNCTNSIGFRIYFSRPISSINFLALDIDGVHGTPNGNAEWVAFFGYNGNTYVPYSISGPTTQLTNQNINTSAAGHSWRTLITNSIGATASAALPNAMTIRRQTTNGGSGTPDDLNHQVLFTPPSSATKVTDFFLMTGIWSVTGQANVQASGLSPIVITISSDFGDAPDSYKTLLASGGPSHGIVGTLSLGDSNLAEVDGQPSALADNSIDDDGVPTIPPLTNNGQLINTYTVSANFHNNTGLAANYAAWIDWNNDGVFQPSEGTAATTSAGTLSGSVDLTWNNVTLTNTSGHAKTYLRVRVTTEAITTADSGGAFMDGEVEDYAIGLPAATPDFACFNAGSSSGPINVLSNDTTGEVIVPLTTGLVNPGTATNIIVDGFGDIIQMTIPGDGIWKINTSGQVAFEPESSSVISPTPIAYNGRDADGNISNNALITLTAASIPVDTTVSSQGCFPTTLTASASVPAGQSIVWYDAATGGNIVASPTLSAVGTITYYAQGNNGTCVTAVRTPVALTITVPPNAGNLSGTQNICQGTTTTFSSDGDAEGTWSSLDPTIASVDSSGIITGLLAGTTTISYTITGTGGCANVFATRTVTVEDATESGTISGNQDICVGGTSVLISSGTPGGLWESEDITIATVDASGLVTGVARGTVNIKYTIIQTGTCAVIPSAYAVNIIQVNPGTLSGNQNVCIGETTTFTTNGDSGGDWTVDNAAIASVDANGVITGNATGTATITYTVSSVSGCPSAFTTRTVTVNVNPPASAADITGNNTEICPGGTALLTVSSSVTNPVFTWYADQTTTTALSTGPTYNVQPASTATYYVSVKGDAICENDPNTRKAITVTVDALGLASDITAGDVAICAGSTAFLTASSSSVTTPVFRWYADQMTTTVLNTGDTYSPSPASTTTYYVSISGDGVCENSINTRKAVVVTVNPLATSSDIAANNQEICGGAAASLTASSRIASPVFRWYADQTTSIVLSTGATFNPSPVSTTTYYVSVAGTEVCENAINTRKAVTVAVNGLATATDIAATDITACPNDAVVLTASSTTVTTPVFRWYADQTTTTILHNGATFSPSPSSTTTYYVSVSGDGVCENAQNSRKAVTVTINPLATDADIIVADQTICSGEIAVLSASSSLINPEFIWYADQTSVTPLSIGEIYGPTPATTTTYYVSVSGDGVCENAINTRKAVVVTVNPLGLDSDITASDAVICSGSSATLTASSSTVTTPVFRWYADQTSITVLSTGATYNVSPATTATYYVSVSGDGVCENAINTRKAVVVTVNPLGLDSDITASDAVICAGASATLTASSTTVATPVFRWYADQTSTTVLSTGATYNVSPATTATYYVSVSGDGVCENAINTRKAVVVTVNPLGLDSDITASDAVICAGASATLTASSTTVAAPVFRWYADQTSTTVLSTGAAYSPTPAVTATYYVSVSGDGVCENAINTRKAVVVTVNPLGLDSDITASDAVICSGSSATLTASSSTVTTPVFRWYADQTSTTVLSTGAAYSPTPAATATYYVSVSGDGVCENAINTRKAVVVTVNPLGLDSDITASDAVICAGASATLTASSTTVAAPVFRWYADQTSTTVLSTGAAYSPTPAATATYYVSVSGDGVCENAINTRKAVVVTVNPLGLDSDITASDAVICSGSSATLTASSSTVTTPVFRWYADQTSITVLSTGATYNVSPATTATYYVSVSGDGVCENAINTRKAVVVTVNPLGLDSDITASDAVICAGASATLTASSTTVATPVFRWYADQTSTTVLSTGATYNVSPATTATYYVSVSGDGVCENAINTRKAVVVTVNPLGLDSDITASDAVICAGASATLTASSTTVAAPVFRWYADQTSTTVLSTGAAYSPTPAATATYYVSVSGDGVCENAINTRKAVVVTVNPLGLDSDITASDAVICAGASAALIASSTTVATPVFRWYADQTSTTVLSTGATYNVSPAATATYYVSMSGDAVCENAINTRKAVVVTVNPLGLASDISVSTANASLCTGGSASITATSAISNPIFKWYQDANLSVLLYTGTTFATPPITVNTSYYVTVQNNAICENSIGNALKVDLTVILCSDIALNKSASNMSPFVGDQVDFTITVSNLGPNDATGVRANDVLPSGYTFISADNGGVLSGNTITWPTFNISVNNLVSLVYRARVNTPAGTADEYKNVAQIAASDNFDPNSTPNNNDPAENDQDSVILTPIMPQPSILLYKDASFSASNDSNGNGLPDVNETITYTFAAQNTGNIRLENVKIDDQFLGISNLSVTPNSLDPGQTGRSQLIYTIKESDFEKGVIYNSAIAQGNTPPTPDNPGGTVVTDASEDPTDPVKPGDQYYDPNCPACTVVPLPNIPKIAIVKEISSFSGNFDNAKVGDVISYLFTVSNIGNTRLSNVKVTDPLPGMSTPALDPVDSSNKTGDLNSNGYLDTNEKWLYRAGYVLTSGDLAKGQVVNQALAEATGPPTPVNPNGEDVNDLSDKSSPTNEDNDPTVLDIVGCQVVVHNAISPNGDSINDRFKIDGIECYPKNTVEIYNRWGVIVFHTDGYNNESNAFEGYSNGRTVINQSKGLPTGTYYYIVRYQNSEEREITTAGYLYLSMNQ